MAFVKTTQGQVFVEVKGSGIPIVLIHSDGSSGLEYEPIVDQLSQNHMLIILDLPGCGRSPRRAFSPAYYKENAKAVIDVVRQLVPGGQSWVLGNGGGAVTALWTAIVYPSNVSGVVADSFTEFLRPHDLQRLPSTDAEPDSEIIEYLRRMHGDDWRIVLQELSRILEEIVQQGRSVMDWRLAEVSCPVLITGSRKDDFLESLAPRLLAVTEQISTAELILYPDGGHPCMWSQQDRFWAHALDFIHKAKVNSEGSKNL